MDIIFEPKLRDMARGTTCSNLIMAGLLLPNEVLNYMMLLHTYNDTQLAEVLCASRLSWDNYLENCWVLN